MATTGPPPSPVPIDPDTVELWANYAKDRFDSATKRVDELRNWARQLTAAIAVVIGIELTLAGKVLDLRPPFDVFLRNSCLFAFFAAVILQAILLLRSLHAGYVGRTVIGPERPSVLADYVLPMTPGETRQVVGAYYATAYDNFFTLSEELGQRVSRVTRTFAWSISLPLVGFAVFVVLTWSPNPASYNRSPMTEPNKTQPQSSPTSQAPTPPAPQPPQDKSPSPASGNPLMKRPTAGLPMTESDHSKDQHHG